MTAALARYWDVCSGAPAPGAQEKVDIMLEHEPSTANNSSAAFASRCLLCSAQLAPAGSQDPGNDDEWQRTEPANE